jgi:hypothetical protein
MQFLHMLRLHGDWNTQNKSKKKETSFKNSSKISKKETMISLKLYEKTVRI